MNNEELDYQESGLIEILRAFNAGNNWANLDRQIDKQIKLAFIGFQLLDFNYWISIIGFQLLKYNN